MSLPTSLAREFRFNQCDVLLVPNLAHLYTEEWVVDLWVQILPGLENERLGVEELNLLCRHCFNFTGLLFDQIALSDQYLRLRLHAFSLGCRN